MSSGEGRSPLSPGNPGSSENAPAPPIVLAVSTQDVCAYLRLAKQRSGAARVGAKRHSGVGSLMSAGWSRRVKALPRCAAHRSGGGRGKTNCLLVSRFVSLTPNSISDWPPYVAWGRNPCVIYVQIAHTCHATCRMLLNNSCLVSISDQPEKGLKTGVGPVSSAVER